MDREREEEKMTKKVCFDGAKIDDAPAGGEVTHVLRGVAGSRVGARIYQSTVAPGSSGETTAARVTRTRFSVQRAVAAARRG